jgi:hypothetical protein
VFNRCAGTGSQKSDMSGNRAQNCRSILDNPRKQEHPWRRCGVSSEGCSLRTSQSQLPLERYLNPERRRALQLLASSPSGVAAELLVLAHEFSRDMLAGLVVAGFATVVAETLKADGPTIKIDRVRITDAGRRAIEG